jgi:hypothetical protein
MCVLSHILPSSLLADLAPSQSALIDTIGGRDRMSREKWIFNHRLRRLRGFSHDKAQNDTEPQNIISEISGICG